MRQRKKKTNGWIKTETRLLSLSMPAPVAPLSSRALPCSLRLSEQQPGRGGRRLELRERGSVRSGRLPSEIECREGEEAVGRFFFRPVVFALFDLRFPLFFSFFLLTPSVSLFLQRLFRCQKRRRPFEGRERASSGQAAGGAGLCASSPSFPLPHSLIILSSLLPLPPSKTKKARLFSLPLPPPNPLLLF
jgi:hypothetical protein